MMAVKSIVNFFVNNSKIMLLLLCLVLTSLWITQCQKTAEVQQENETIINTANQNLEALVGDQATQMKLTREQLKRVNEDMGAILDSVESLRGIQGKVKETVVTKIEYVPIEVKTPNTLVMDTINGRYGLAFTDEDSVKTIEGISWFRVVDTVDNQVRIEPDSTNIKKFDFNFDLVISKYVDDSTGFTKYDITPFHVNSDGTLGGAISENLLKLNYRGVELINEPWKPLGTNTTTGGYKRGGWAIHISPLSAGFMTNGKETMLGVGPTVGVSYVIKLGKSK